MYSLKTIFFLLLCSINLSAQTFSLITDPVEGDETIFHNNSVVDMVIAEDKIVLSGQHTCLPNPGESNTLVTCSSLSSFDLDGGFNSSILIDSFYEAQTGGLVATDSSVFTANFKHSGLSNNIGLYVQEYDKALHLVRQNIVSNTVCSRAFNHGVKYIKDHFFVYGEVTCTNNKVKGYVQKLDYEFNLIWEKLYEHEEASNSCDKLQETNDGNLIFFHTYRSEFTGPSNSGLQIVKLDSNGIKLDSLQIDGEGNEVDGLGLLSDLENMIYVFTVNHPNDDSIFEQSQGRINKYTENLDTLLWSLKLPTDIIIDRRRYFMSDFELAKNGDILACGAVLDDSPDGNTALENNYVSNAFITRISPDGEIKWFHIYKAPNVNQQIPAQEYGDFQRSNLARIEETDDGRIVAAGTVQLAPGQASFVVGTTDPWSHFFLLAVDGETGCIEGEECNEIIILDGKNRPRGNYLPLINAEYTWVVDHTDESGQKERTSYTFANDSVLQFIDYYHEREVTPSLSKTSLFPTTYYKESGGRVDQYSSSTLGSKVVFDIHLEVGEVLTVEREGGPVDLIAVATDTIKLLDDVPRKRIILKCIEEQSTSGSIVWVEGIGELDNNESCGLSNPRTKILCVSDQEGNTIYSQDDEGCQSYFGCTSHTFSVGDKWTYDNRVFLDTFFTVFKIVDEVNWMGKQALRIEPGITSDTYMIQENDKVYFWDEILEEYQLHYDFNNDSVYYIRYYDFVKSDVDSTAVFIDSVRMVQYNGKAVQAQYCRSDFGGSFFETSFEIIRNVGSSILGPKMPISVIIDNFAGGIGMIRCFDSSDCSLQFVDYPCDTVFTTSIYSFDERQDVEIYPNPVQDNLYINSFDKNWNFEIVNFQGVQVKQGEFQNFIAVEDLPAGIYFLRLQDEDTLLRAIKFVKY